MGLCLPAHWQEEEEEAARGAGVCNRIGGWDGDSCGRGLRKGLGQVEKGWAWGLCSFIILEAAPGPWDPYSSVSPEPLCHQHSLSRCVVSHGQGPREVPSILGGSEKKQGVESQPWHLLVVWF